MDGDFKTIPSEDFVKQSSTSSETTLTRSEEDKSLSNTADATIPSLSSGPTDSDTSGTNNTSDEQKN